MLQESAPKNLQRLLSFSDGVIAIAITILVLRIDLPITLDKSTLMPTLVQLLPQLEMYVISFIVIAYYWMGHHNIFMHMSRVDGPLMWLNILFLMMVCLLPLSTDLVGTYQSVLTMTIYFSNLCLSGILQAAIWFYGRRLGFIDCDPRFVRFMAAKVITAPLLFLAAIPIARWNLSVSANMWVLIAVAPFLYRKIFRYGGRVEL